MRSLFLALLFAWAGAAFAQADQPNLIVIMTDDQGQWAMGAYGNQDIHTPNMDRIASEGALFTDAICVTPVCSASRAAYFTGLYPTQLGITDWISPIEAQQGLGLKHATWPQALQKHGYRTGLIGKWHLGEKPEFHPTRLGFDYFLGFLNGGNRPNDPVLEVDGKTEKLTGPLPDLLTDAALKFIAKESQQPFALCLHYRAPHTPYLPVPDEDAAHYKDLDPKVPHPPGADINQLKRWHREYYSSISSVDRNIGRLLEALDQQKLSERTIVIFTSDHGYNLGRHGVHTKGNGHWIAGGVHGPKRPNMWATSLQVPLAVRWPGVVQPGTKVKAPVSFLDMYRSVLGMLNLPLPEDCQALGTDFSPVLRGESLPPRPARFAQYDLHNNGLAFMRMVRTDRYKYVRHFKAYYMDELYDLQKDPGETQNLIRRGGMPQDAQPLVGMLDQWMKSINDPLLQGGY